MISICMMSQQCRSRSLQIPGAGKVVSCVLRVSQNHLKILAYLVHHIYVVVKN